MQDVFVVSEMVFLTTVSAKVWPAHRPVLLHSCEQSRRPEIDTISKLLTAILSLILTNKISRLVCLLFNILFLSDLF